VRLGGHGFGEDQETAHRPRQEYPHALRHRCHHERVPAYGSVLIRDQYYCQYSENHVKTNIRNALTLLGEHLAGTVTTPPDHIPIPVGRTAREAEKVILAVKMCVLQSFADVLSNACILCTAGGGG
jgi:hypothetical protein